ncbi:MAG: MFS transporter [Acidobacteriota bacterium]
MLEEKAHLKAKLLPTPERFDPKWTALAAAMSGYMLDAMDVILYIFALGAIRQEFGLSNAEAGMAMAATMLASAAGGIGAGVLSDRIGRRPALMITILLYSFGSALSATSTGLWSLMFWRAVVGLGLGGEWSSGTVLVAESWPAQHRAKAIGMMQSGFALGYMLAAALAALVLPRWGWRVLFLIGVLPALLTFLIRRHVREPEVWLKQERPAPFLALFRGALLRRTLIATALATAMLFGYWGLFTWLPSFLASPIEAGGAGLALLKTSGWTIAVQVGSLLGYWCFGWLADRFGRRITFFLYVAGAAAVIPIYGFAPRWAGGSLETVLLIIGPAVGFLGTGSFALFGTMLAELYPTASRGAGQGFAYNFGRALAAAAPVTIGRVADSSGLGTALGLNAGFYLLAGLMVWTLPETKGVEID